MTFINKYSYKCLLGPRSSHIGERDGIYSWIVNNKQHFSTSRQLTLYDFHILRSIAPSNFHYLSSDNVSFLKQHYNVHKTNLTSIIIPINKLSLVGKKISKTRQLINKCAKNNFELLDNYRSIDDVKEMINNWSTNYTDKYFRDFSGKNLFFYRNNFHLNCLNLFVYFKDRLVSFGTLSPNESGTSSYIIGKALYKNYPGLSEYTDFMLYQKALKQNIEQVNLGQASKGLLFYKNKFGETIKETHHDGSIEIR